MEIQMIPQNGEVRFQNVDIEVEKIVEKEIIVEKEKQIFIDRPIEKIIQKETIKLDDNLFKLIANINANLESFKKQVNEDFNRYKFDFQNRVEFKQLQGQIESILLKFENNSGETKSSIYKNLNSIRQELILLVDVVKNIPRPEIKDYTKQFELINKLINQTRGDINLYNKLPEITSFLVSLMKKIDSINVNPQVNVTTQIVRNEDLVEQIKKLVEQIESFRNDQKSKLLEIVPKLDSVKATVEKDLQFLKVLTNENLEITKNLKQEISKEVLNKIEKSNIFGENLKNVQDILNIFTVRFSEDMKQSFETSFKSFVLGIDTFKQEIETFTTNKLFEILVDVKNIIRDVLKQELDSYLSSVQIKDTEIKDEKLNMFDFLNMVKSTISQTIETTKEKNYLNIVEKFEDLPYDDFYKNRIIKVKKVSFLKRNRIYLFDGMNWNELK